MLEAHPPNRVLSSVWAVGAVPGHRTYDSTTYAVNCQFSVLDGQAKLFTQVGDDQFILAAFLACREDVSCQFIQRATGSQVDREVVDFDASHFALDENADAIIETFSR